MKKKKERVIEKVTGFTGAFGFSVPTDTNVKVSDESNRVTKTLTEIFGYCGKMLYGSKSFGREDCEKKGWIFIPNANLFLEGGYKVWYGDFIINKTNKSKLNKLMSKLNKRIYLLYESTGRFLAEPPIDTYLQEHDLLNKF